MSDVNTLPETPEPPEHLPSEPHHPLQGGQHQLSNPLLSGALTAVLPLAQDPPTVSGRVPMERRLSQGRDDTVSQTLVKIRAKVKKKVHDVDALLGQIIEWMDDSDLGRTAGDDLSVVSDMSVVRDLWRKRGRDDEGADDSGSASRDNGTSKR